MPPWQARKLYEGGIGGFGGPKDTAVPVSTSVYDPLLGMSWQQLGMRARAMHRCQGASQVAADLGPTEGLLPAGRRRAARRRLAKPTSWTASTRRSPACGASLRRTQPLAAQLQALEPLLAAARAAFDPRSPEAAAPALASALAGVRALRGALPGVVDDARARAEIDGRLQDEEQDVEAALQLAHGLVLEARVDDGLVTPGQSLGVSVTLASGAPRALEVEGFELEAPAGWTVERRDDGARAGGASRAARFQLTVAPDARPSQPYWRKLPDRDRNELVVPADETLPWSPPPVWARARLRVAGVATTVRAPAVFATRAASSAASGGTRSRSCRSCR